MGKNLWPFIPYTVIPALHGDTSHHRGVNAGIQGFEVNDWMPAYHCGHDGQRTRDIRLRFKKTVQCLSSEL